MAVTRPSLLQCVSRTLQPQHTYWTHNAGKVSARHRRLTFAPLINAMCNSGTSASTGPNGKGGSLISPSSPASQAITTRLLVCASALRALRRQRRQADLPGIAHNLTRAAAT